MSKDENILVKINRAFYSNDLLLAQQSYDIFHKKALDKLKKAYSRSKEEFEEKYIKLYKPALDKIIDEVVLLDFFDLYKYMNNKKINIKYITLDNSVSTLESNVNVNFTYASLSFTKKGLEVFDTFKGSSILLENEMFNKIPKYLNYFNIKEDTFWSHITRSDLKNDNDKTLLSFFKSLDKRNILNQLSIDYFKNILGSQRQAQSLHYLLNKEIINKDNYKDFIFYINTIENLEYDGSFSHYPQVKKTDVIEVKTGSEIIINAFFDVSEEVANRLSDNVLIEFNKRNTKKSKTTLTKDDLNSAFILLKKEIIEYKSFKEHSKKGRRIL